MADAASTETVAVKTRKKRDPNAPVREIPPRPLYIVYTVGEDNLVTTHLNSRKAEEVLAHVDANPGHKYLRIMVK